MKKLYSMLILVIFTIALIPAQALASPNTGYFVVTAYYSPLPNQQYYLTWNYKSEIRLNGRGIAWASWKWVFSWMLAAPKNYRFWTKIYLQWLWVGSVEDRGWAIVNAGQRWYRNDRIDVWVGYWDEWLRRALYWGKRKVRGRIVANQATTINYKNISAPNWATNWLKQVPTVFNVGLWKWSNVAHVKNLQKVLKEVGKYNGKIDGIYNKSVIDTVYNFQIENGIPLGENNYWAWYWGKQTRDLFFKKYLNGEFDQETDNIVEDLTQSEKQESGVFDIPAKTASEIKKLQQVLKDLKLYDGDLTGDYEDIRKNILEYQLKKSIVKSTSELWASHFGPKTRGVMKEDYKQYEEQEKIRKEEEKRRKELEKKLEKLKELAWKKAETELANLGHIQLGQTSPRVREFQILLRELWYFDRKDTAIFGPQTRLALIQYQLDHKIILDKHDLGAGFFGPKTREQIKKDIQEQIYVEMAVEFKKENNLFVLK